MSMTNIWVQPDNINNEIGEAKQVPAYCLYGKELYLYGTVVMASDVHVRLLFAQNPVDDIDIDDDTEEDDIHKDRFQTFCDDLAALFQKEVADKYHLKKEMCVLHIDLTEDNMTAIVGIQHCMDYHYFVKDHQIPLKEYI